MSGQTITFYPDGTGQCLYTEVIDLSVLGSLEIERASNIEFDNKRQVWRVMDLKGQPLYEDKSRQTCLEWEQGHFNQDNHDTIVQDNHP